MMQQKERLEKQLDFIREIDKEKIKNNSMQERKF
jgi:hypothetical protein